ncbi:hypothetical protein ACH5RR_025532 [Cinchona calisaya]|uniref:CNNM transmembrane domain-containing protein n=1 Tax=Cinchona calisaya TaxID=153742 RepID=A0ABD2Z3A0_9GENT
MNFDSYIENHQRKKYIKYCDSDFFLQIIVVILFTLFAGLMNGLTLGYMSLNRVDLEVLVKSGVSKSRIFASRILSLVKRRHLLLCTLLISKAFAVEALPIFLHHLIPETAKILISSALILIFSEIIPHSVCSKYGLVIGAAMAPALHLLVWICFPAAYPIRKLLDFLLGRGRIALYRRAELKTLVDLHGNKAGKGGDLSHHEISIIKGALELTEKTAKDAMTLASEIFSVDINAKLDRDLINLILQKGHSRVPVYHEQPSDIIGLILFQRGLSHMAVVIRPKSSKVEESPDLNPRMMGEVRLEVYDENHQQKRGFRSSLRMLKTLPGNQIVPRSGNSRSRRWSGESHPEILNISDNPLLAVPQEEEVVGIITTEDVIENLLKEDIYDEMDHYGSSSTSFRGSSQVILKNHNARCSSSELSDRINSFKLLP